MYREVITSLQLLVGIYQDFQQSCTIRRTII